MDEKVKKNYTGVILAVGILIVMGLAVSIALDVPISKAFALPSVPSGGPEHQVNITLYADAAGWNYNHGTVNPVIVIPPKTQIEFTVIEEDNQPHTLTIAPGSQESTTQATLLSQTDITTTPGHISHTNAYFATTGEYTYWCTIHPVTMVGQLYVNSSAAVPTNATGSVTTGGSHNNGVTSGSLVSAQNMNGNMLQSPLHPTIASPLHFSAALSSVLNAVNKNSDISGVHDPLSRSVIVRMEN